MAKIRKEDIVQVIGTYFHNTEKGIYPISWNVRLKGRGIRKFESYGKNATDFDYPIEKLPKAVQEFLETAKASKPIYAFPKETVLYTKN